MLGAVVIQGGNVISTAANMSRPYGLDNCGFHAEKRALRGRKDFKGAVIIVVRMNTRGKLSGMSRPCPKCMKVIREKKIKKIIYVNDNREICIEKVQYSL